jgi:hypothetical protein
MEERPLAGMSHEDNRGRGDDPGAGLEAGSVEALAPQFFQKKLAQSVVANQACQADGHAELVQDASGVESAASGVETDELHHVRDVRRRMALDRLDQDVHDELAYSQHGFLSMRRCHTHTCKLRNSLVDSAWKRKLRCPEIQVRLSRGCGSISVAYTEGGALPLGTRVTEA